MYTHNSSKENRSAPCLRTDALDSDGTKRIKVQFMCSVVRTQHLVIKCQTPCQCFGTDALVSISANRLINQYTCSVHGPMVHTRDENMKRLASVSKQMPLLVSGQNRTNVSSLRFGY